MQAQLIDSSEALAFSWASRTTEEVLQRARASASVASVDHHGQVLCYYRWSSTIFQLRRNGEWY